MTRRSADPSKAVVDEGSIHSPSTIPGVVSRLVGRTSPNTRVVLFAGALIGFGVFFLWLTPSRASTPERDWALPFFGLVIAFGLCEATALHVEIRKQSQSLSLSSIPLMFGLLYLSPIGVAAAYVVGLAPTMLWIRQSDPIKTIWNSSLIFAETALACFVVRSILGDDLPRNGFEWLIPLSAVLIAELLSLLAVPLVIMVVDAKFHPHLFADAGQSQILTCLAGMFTVTAVSASVGDPFMLIYAVVPVIGIGAFLQSSGHLAQRFKDLQQLHRFTRALTNERGTRTLDAGLVQLVEIMRTKTACLLTVGDGDQRTSIRALVDDRFEDLDPEPIEAPLLAVLESSGVTLLTTDDARSEVSELLHRLRATKLLAAPVLGEVDKAGVLFVTDRLGMRSDFSDDELRLFGSLAGTLSSRLSNDHLVAELETQAQHDSLTGLPNRLGFEIALTSLLSDPQQAGTLLMIDLDRFKEINDSLGHETGDRLLVEVANRLRAGARSTDIIARFGGDEFAVVLTGRPSDDPADLVGRVGDIHDRIVAKFELEGIVFDISASVGAVRWPAEGRDSVSLLRCADSAMNEAKRNQLGVLWYSPDLDSDAPRRLALYLSARAALDKGEFFVHFQPKVSIETGRITGAEALARWTHPTYGPISPAEFVPLIGQAGMIGKLTRFVIQSALETSVEFSGSAITIPIAVNLTPRDLLDPTLPEDIGRMLSEAGVEATSLHVEITEDAMVVDFDTSIRVLTEIRELGVLVAIDDFGTGYSSLQHLHRLPVDQLKIDRSFVARLATDSSALAIVRASVNLANDLGLGTIAEGIEDEATLRLLAEIGCREAQGYYVSRPVASLDFVRWARDWEPERLTMQVNRAANVVALTSALR